MSPANVDDDVLALAEVQEAAAADYRQVEIRSWKDSILATIVMIVCGVIDGIPMWAVVLSSIITGHFLGRALMARRRRRTMITQSTRLRALLAQPVGGIVMARKIRGSMTFGPNILVITDDDHRSTKIGPNLLVITDDDRKTPKKEPQ